MMLMLYRGLTTVAAPLVSLALWRRSAVGKEDAGRLDERLGRTDRSRPQGALVWLHGASVGESLSALALIERLLTERPGLNVLVTTGTVTSARLMAERLPAGAFHQFAPVDRLEWVRRFLDHWRPDLALWMESELWPNLVSETARRGVPMVIVNGRMSPKSYAGWQRWPSLVRPLLADFDLCLVQSEEDGRRFADLGARRVACPGNLKFAAAPLPADGEALSELAARIGERPLWLAASTHPGEEDMAADAHRRLSEQHPRLLTVIVPRHPERGRKIADSLRAAGLSVTRRGAGEPITEASQIYLADTLGELGLFYRLAGIVLMGGSLVRHGGQNPIEPAHLDCAIIHGPHMTNFGEIARKLAAAEASEVVADAGELAAAVARLMAEPGLRERRAEAAQAVAARERGVLDRTMAALAPRLAELPRPASGRARARA